MLQKAFKTNYARIDAKELPNLLRQIQVYPGRHVTRIAIKLLALTFVRTGELIAAKWSEFNFDDARWTIPAERMKMRNSHIIPLSRQALDSLAELQVLTGAHVTVLTALQVGEIRIHRAGTWLESSKDGGMQDYKNFRNETGIRRTIKTLIAQQVARRPPAPDDLNELRKALCELSSKPRF